MNKPDFSRRSTQLEFMDDPNCDVERLLRTIRQFRLTNPLFSRYRTILRKWFIDDMLSEPGREYHWLDVGAGGGDIPVWMIREARKSNLSLRVTAIDKDQRTIDYLKSNLPDDVSMEIVCDDIFQWLENRRDIDYLFCNNFIHHLPDPVILDFLRLLDRTIQRRFVISDLKRCGWGYFGYSLFAALFLHRSFAFSDGRLSVLRGFTRTELHEYVSDSGISMNTQVESMFPARLVMAGKR